MLIPDAAGGTHCVSCLLKLALNQGQFPDSDEEMPFLEQPGDQIGRYKLLQQVGEGGCGVVYLADQEEPVRRKVALKVIKLGMDTKSVVARFEAEQQAMAMMDHPNIAKVFDAGITSPGRPFFVMEFVRGIEVTSFCDQNNLSMRERLNLFVQICNAVQHAHQKGVIHRDIKPSNILVVLENGVPLPKVIDFGIAKATQQRLTDKTLFTAVEQFIGTPAYMSPEQAAMDGSGIDTRSDIYSLGVLLYELLTGHTPFESKTLRQAGVDEIRRIIREEEPVKPSTRLELMTPVELTSIAGRRKVEAPKLVQLIRGDLDWIVMKALEKHRARRYETASSLARDVEHHLKDEPVNARPPGNLYRFQKLVRRNRLPFAAAIAVTAALMIGLGLFTWQYIATRRAEKEQVRLRIAAEKAQAEEVELRQQAEAQGLASRKHAYAADMNLLQMALADEDLPRAQEILDRQRPSPGQEDLRGWEWRYFWQFCRSDAAFTLCQRSSSVISVSFSRDGTLMAVGTWEGEISVWELATRKMILQDDSHCGCPRRVAFSPMSDVLAYYQRDPDTAKYIVLWDSRTRKELRRLPLHESVRDLIFAGDGTLQTAEFGYSNNIIRWNIQNGEVLNRVGAALPTYLKGNAICVTADGNRFAHIMYANAATARVVDGYAIKGPMFGPGEDFISSLRFSPDGKTLLIASGTTEPTITTWDFEARKPLDSMTGHHGWISALKFMPDGRMLASSSADRTIRLWNIETHQLTRTLHNHGGEVWAMDVSPDGRWIAGGGVDGSVVLWDSTPATNQTPTHSSRTVTPAVKSWNYTPDGKYMAIIQEGHLRLCDPQTWKVVSEPTMVLDNVTGFAFSPDMHWIAGVDAKGNISVSDFSSQRTITNFAAYPANAHIMGAGFLADGSNLVTFDEAEIVKIWDTKTWQQKKSWQLRTFWQVVGMSPVAGLGALGNADSGAIELLDLYNPDKALTLQGERRMENLTFSPNGKILASVNGEGVLKFWDTQSGQQLARLKTGGLGLHSVAISGDNNRVVAGGDGHQAIKLWDLSSLEALPSLAAKGSIFDRVVFSPDGNTITARTRSGEFHSWTAPSWEQIAVEEKSRAVR